MGCAILCYLYSLILMHMLPCCLFDLACVFLSSFCISHVHVYQLVCDTDSVCPRTQLAWAPGRGVKGAGLKAFWDQEGGSSYIPWSFIKMQADLNTMADGGWVDPPTCPPGFEPPPLPRGL